MEEAKKSETRRGALFRRISQPAVRAEDTTCCANTRYISSYLGAVIMERRHHARIELLHFTLLLNIIIYNINIIIS
jgi:hypothetical protein